MATTIDLQLGTPWARPGWMGTLNRILTKLHSPFELRTRFDHRADMVSVEQVANFELLINTLIEDDVPGAFTEFGCYTGSTTAAIGSLLAALDRGRPFHVYDRFDIEFGVVHGIRAQFERTLERFAVPMPHIHAGDIYQTVPEQLPHSIAFAHLDLGIGGSVQKHSDLVGHVLSAIYDRMMPHGVMVFMDYHVPGRTVHGNDSNPGIRLACDAFFRNKPERIQLLYGGPCSHAYVRKASGAGSRKLVRRGSLAEA